MYVDEGAVATVVALWGVGALGKRAMLPRTRAVALSLVPAGVDSRVVSMTRAPRLVWVLEGRETSKRRSSGRNLFSTASPKVRRHERAKGLHTRCDCTVRTVAAKVQRSNTLLITCGEKEARSRAGHFTRTFELFRFEVRVHFKLEDTSSNLSNLSKRWILYESTPSHVSATS